MENPFLIQGGQHTDYRGKVSFVNEFTMDRVKRFYCIEHLDINVVRAWQGHQRENKWFFVVTGGYQIMVVKPDNWTKPSINLAVEKFELIADQNQVLYVPGGHATGFRALDDGAKMLVFSDLSVEESCKDDFRFEKDLWHNWQPY